VYFSRILVRLIPDDCQRQKAEDSHTSDVQAARVQTVLLLSCADLELTATCCVKLRLSLSFSLLSHPDLKLICFLLLSANYSTYLFRQRPCSRLMALQRFINVVLLLLLLLLL